MKSIATISLVSLGLLVACSLPPEKKASPLRTKNNYIVLLDLSDRLIVQDNQPARDKEIIRKLYGIFENNVREDLYVKSRDEFRVVIAPQHGSGLRRDVFEDRLYYNMGKIPLVQRKAGEADRRTTLFANLDTLYQCAAFSRHPDDYYGADIWKYFYEDLKTDYSTDTLTQNYLFILTDGYPIVGHDQQKLLDVNKDFSNLHVVLVEAAPRDKDMEWDHIMDVWDNWFRQIGIKDYTLIKRGSITKEMEEIEALTTTQQRDEKVKAPASAAM